MHQPLRDLLNSAQPLTAVFSSSVCNQDSRNVAGVVSVTVVCGCGGGAGAAREKNAPATVP